jgi:hypothetical protein
MFGRHRFGPGSDGYPQLNVRSAQTQEAKVGSRSRTFGLSASTAEAHGRRFTANTAELRPDGTTGPRASRSA